MSDENMSAENVAADTAARIQAILGCEAAAKAPETAKYFAFNKLDMSADDAVAMLGMVAGDIDAAVAAVPAPAASASEGNAGAREAAIEQLAQANAEIGEEAEVEAPVSDQAAGMAAAEASMKAYHGIN